MNTTTTTTKNKKSKKYVVRLTENERAYLRTLIGGGTAPARMLSRARILLKTDEGEGGAAWSDAAIAEALEVGLSTVARVRQRYVSEGLEATLRRKAPDREYRRKLDGVSYGGRHRTDAALLRHARCSGDVRRRFARPPVSASDVLPGADSLRLRRGLGPRQKRCMSAAL